MLVYSKRFDKEFEVETITLNDGKQMLSYQGLLECLEQLGDSVRVKHNYVPTPPVFMWETTIEDDTGVKVTEIGSVNITEENDKIALQRVPETAKSRALRVAIAKYFGFPEKLGKAEPKAAPAAIDDPTADINTNEDPVVTDAAPSAAPATTSDADPGEFLITFGKAMNGKKIKELTQGQREWLAGSDFNPRNDVGKKAKEAAIAFIAASK